MSSGYVLAALRLARIRLRGYAYLRIVRKYGSALALLLRNTRNNELRLCARRFAACAHTPTPATHSSKNDITVAFDSQPESHRYTPRAIPSYK